MNGQVVTPDEGKSSPSSFTTTKGSSVWLHWNYTYIGDGRHSGAIPTTTNYSKQEVGFNNPLQPLARRIGQNGALLLESPTPASFNGRVEVISSNSTLVIHNLKFNDSTYQFLSAVGVYLHVGGRTYLDVFTLRPIVRITVNGMLQLLSFALFYKFNN